MRTILLALAGLWPTCCWADTDASSLKADRESGLCKDTVYSHMRCNDICIYRPDLDASESKAFFACHRKCDADNGEILKWNDWARQCRRQPEANAASLVKKSTSAVSDADRREMEELRQLQQRGQRDYEAAERDNLSDEERKEMASCYGDKQCQEIYRREFQSRRLKRAEEAKVEKELDQRMLHHIEQTRERKAREAVEAERMRNSPTAEEVLNSASRIFMGVAAQQMNSQTPSPAAPPVQPPTYVPDTTGSIGTRPQTITPRNTGSSGRTGVTCIDAAPANASTGRPRC